jgi:phage terminase large subunit-like protein
MLNWTCGNLLSEARGSNVYMHKRSAADKIDPMMASFNAIEMMSRNPSPAKTKSVYETRGVLYV